MKNMASKQSALIKIKQESHRLVYKHFKLADPIIYKAMHGVDFNKWMQLPWKRQKISRTNGGHTALLDQLLCGMLWKSSALAEHF